VPNLNANRGFWVAGPGAGLNVRRLMYQSLIWSAVLRNQPRRLSAALHAQDCKRLADALVDRVRRNVELGRNLLGREVLVDEAKAVQLALAQARDALSGDGVTRRVCRPVRGFCHNRRLLPS
jgi:hypothetical protein